ncbi:hypothetical protein, partial [Streptococcus pneumoniae]|uniref:hypothetical protein n=1 Tax=Streptococcus pneumoniae TaxID=1313 RepID=UPI0018B0CC77
RPKGKELAPGQAIQRFYGFIKQVTEGPYGMSIRDVMDTSWEDLMGVLGSMKTSEQEEVVDLADFLESL